MRDDNQKLILAISIDFHQLKIGLFDAFGKCFASTSIANDIQYKSGGGVEQNPNLWLADLKTLMRKLFAQYYFRAEDIEMISVTGNSGTSIAVDNEGNSIRNAIIAYDTRGEKYSKDIFSGKPAINGYNYFKAKKWFTSLAYLPLLSGQDHLGHILYVKNNLPVIYNQTFRFLEAKDFLIYKLSGEYSTTSEASYSYGLANFKTLKYNENLLKAVDLPADKLPPIMEQGSEVGKLTTIAANELGLIPGIKIVNAGSFYTNAILPLLGQSNSHFLYFDNWSYFVKKADDVNSLSIKSNQFYNHLWGDIYQYNLPETAKINLENIYSQFFEEDIDDLLEKAQEAKAGSHNLLFVPYGGYAQARNLERNLKSGFHHLQMKHQKQDVLRSVIEGIMFNLKHIFLDDVNRSEKLRIGGEFSQNDFVVQIMADIFNCSIERVKNPEIINLQSAALLAGYQKGITNKDDIASLIKEEQHFEPNPKLVKKYEYIYEKYLKIIEN